MTNELENYLNKVEEYRQAYGRAYLLVDHMQHSAQLLSDWRNLAMTTGSPYPRHLLEKETLNPAHLPSVTDLDAALSAYHDTKDAMKNAYKAIPHNVLPIIKRPEEQIAEIEKRSEPKHSE